MPEHPDTSFITPILIFCAGAVIAVPLFRRLGLGAVIGYLAAGLVIGPYGLRLFNDAATVSAVAELGVVLLLFVVGLELKLSRLVAMRRDIFGLGLAQFRRGGGGSALPADATAPRCVTSLTARPVIERPPSSIRASAPLPSPAGGPGCTGRHRPAWRRPGHRR